MADNTRFFAQTLKMVGLLLGGAVLIYTVHYVLVYGFIPDLVSFLVLHFK
jgi:hypothetical protein